MSNANTAAIEHGAAPRADWRDWSRQVALPTIVMGCLVVSFQAVTVVLALTGQIPLWVGTLLLSPLAYWGFTVAHEAGHGNIHGEQTGLRPLGDLLGYLCCIALVFPYPALRAIHNLHHAHSNHPTRDPDYWINGDNAFELLFKSMAIVPHYIHEMYFGSASGEAPIRAVKGITAIMLGLTLAILVTLSVLGYWREVLSLYIVPALFASTFLALVFDWIPHRPYARQGRFLDTRIYLGRGLATITCFQNYHLVHHAFPRIPFYRYKQYFEANRSMFEANGAVIEHCFKPGQGLFSDQQAWDLPSLQAENWYDVAHIERVRETEEAVSLTLTLPGTVVLKPGQYMAVRAWIDGVPRDRCYSIVRAWENKVELGVKRVPGGLVSGWLGNMAIDAIRLQVKGPAGDFFVARDQEQLPKIIIAGGSGITPTLAIASSLLDQGHAPILFVYSSRDPGREIFGERLDSLAREYGSRFSLQRVYTKLQGHLDSSSLSIMIGEWLSEHGMKITECDSYLCGPGLYMDMAQSALRGMGALEEAVHQERFVADFSGASALAADDEAAHELLVEYGSEHIALRIKPGANILAGVLEAGIAAPHGCGSGICSTCMCQLVSGAVEQTSAAGLTRDEENAGKILICSSKATADARLRVG